MSAVMLLVLYGFTPASSALLPEFGHFGGKTGPVGTFSPQPRLMARLRAIVPAPAVRSRHARDYLDETRRKPLYSICYSVTMGQAAILHPSLG